MNKIITTHEYPPVSNRKYDWVANRQEWDEGDPIGTGATELDAINDLVNQEKEIEFEKGYNKGWQEGTQQGIKEIHKNYNPKI